MRTVKPKGVAAPPAQAWAWDYIAGMQGNWRIRWAFFNPRNLWSLPSLSRLFVLIFIVVPIAAWFLVRPIRVVAPAMTGMDCEVGYLCVDDPARQHEARLLYGTALRFVDSQVGNIEGRPRVVFCSTEACARSFGLGARSAVTVGSQGSVIGPRAWKAYYVQHELIHQLQAQRLGMWAVLTKPGWFIEGMAYALSEDPRPELAQPWQDYRERFRAWFKNKNAASMWVDAKNL